MGFFVWNGRNISFPFIPRAYIEFPPAIVARVIFSIQILLLTNDDFQDDNGFNFCFIIQLRSEFINTGL